MYLRELFLDLFEGKEEFLANRDGEKLLAAVEYKNDQKFDDPLVLVNQFSSAVGPKYLQWVCRTYIKDEHFKVEDLADLAQTLKDYENLKRLGAINPNIDSFKTVGELNQEVSKHSKDASDKSDIFRYKQAMREMAEAGAAELKELGGVLFYYPHSWEACKALREANPDDVKLCVTYLDTPAYYNEYTEQGALNFFIVDQKLYLFYFNTLDIEELDDLDNYLPNEFADASNVHIDPAALYKKYPVILKEYYEFFENDPGAILNGPDTTDDEKLRIIEKDIKNIKLLNNPDEGLLKKIIEATPKAIVYLSNASENLRMMALKADPGIIGDYLFEPTANEITSVFDYILENPTSVRRSTMELFTDAQIELYLLKNPERVEFVPRSKLTSELVKKLILRADPSDKESEILGKLLFLVKNPDSKLLTKVIQLSPGMIGQIKNPPEELKIAAITASNGAVVSDYIKELDKESLKVALSYGTGFDKITQDNTDTAIIKYAIDQHLQYRPNRPMDFLHRATLTPMLQYYILKRAPESIGYIKNIDPKLQKRFQTMEPTTAAKFEPGEIAPENQLAFLKKYPYFLNKITNPTDQTISYMISKHPKMFYQTATNPSERSILQFIKKYPEADVNPNWTLTPRIQKILQLKDEYIKKNPWVARSKIDMNAIAKAAIQPTTYQPTNTSDNVTATPVA